MSDIKKVLVVMDSFKGCMSSIDAGNAVACSINNYDCSIDVRVKPFADGGEGTLECLVPDKSSYINVDVSYPAGDRGTASYGILNGTAIIESARCVGITLVDDSKRNIFNLGTYGLGQMIMHAYENGCRDFFITLGGSGTNDGGVGMLMAMGVEFFDVDHNAINPTLGGMSELASISIPDSFSKLSSECSFTAACDVNNPLCGSAGASAVFGPQKGLNAEDVDRADDILRGYALLSDIALNHESLIDFPGSGAAGGLGFALHSYLNARLISGAQAVIDMTGISEDIKWADVIFTGEGKIDRQSIMGKGIGVITNLVKQQNKRIIALGGQVADENILRDNNFEAYSIDPGNLDLQLLMRRDIAFDNLKNTVTKVLDIV